MKGNATLLLAILACVFCVANTELQDIESHLVTKFKVPYSTRDFYVRFQASGKGKDDKLCGGVRLNAKWILTAAECLDKTQYTHVRITTLTNKINLTHHDEVLQKLDYSPHPKYDNKTKANNLALVKVNYIDWNEDFSHVSLPGKSDSSKSFVNKTASVTGYNQLTKPVPGKVLFLPDMVISIQEPSVCKNLFPREINKTDLVCVIPIRGNGVTKDDAGAPLTFTFLGKHTLFAMALHPVGRPATDGVIYPMFFTRIAPYLRWISINTKIPIKK